MMRKRKKMFLWLAVLCLVFTSACGGTAGPPTALNPKSPVSVTLWHYYVGENQMALEDEVSRFNQTVGIEKGIIVEAVGLGAIADLEASVTDSAMGVITAKPMPQIFSSYPDKAMEIDGYDMVLDLSDYFTDEEKAGYVDSFLKDGIFGEGRLLLVPIVKSTELLYVNATRWNEFAAETGHTEADLGTWESMYRVAKAYYEWSDAKTPDIPWDGDAFMGFDSVANYIIAAGRQLGVEVIHALEDGTGEAVLQEDILRRVFGIYWRGMTLGYFGADGKFRSDDIKAGVLAAYVGSSSSAAYFPTWIEEDNRQLPIDFLPLPYPVFEGGEACAIQQGAGMCVGVSTPGQQEGAAEFLKWFTQVEQNISFAMTTGYLPVQKAAYESPEFTEALQALRNGDKAQQNVAGVYEITLHQVIDAETYAAKPFDGSYKVRSVLQSTLISAAEKDLETAEDLKSRGLSEQEILDQLDENAAFSRWLEEVRLQLRDAGIPCVATAS